VVRAEGKEPKDNPRFVITNMKQTPQWLYEEVYCQRGEIENRISTCARSCSSAAVTCRASRWPSVSTAA